MQYIVGIDEAGRGSWAWPIVVGWFLIPVSMLESVLMQLPWLTDSKKIPHKRREALFATIDDIHFSRKCRYAVAYRDAHKIDNVGIREANRQSMQDVIVSLTTDIEALDIVHIYIDGADNFIFDSIDAHYAFAKKRKRKQSAWTTNNNIYQSVANLWNLQISYHIWWDATIPVVSIASIIAKVSRDRMMCDFSVDFPGYNFDAHKWYGTLWHRKSLQKYGVTNIHRKSYNPVKTLIFDQPSI